MPDPRASLLAVALVAGCAVAAPSSGSGARRIASAGDSADDACRVTLRTSFVNLQSRLGPETDCSSGTCWVVIRGSLDVANELLAAGATPGVLYQSAADGTWREGAALPAWGAGMGYRRHEFVLRRDTFTAGPGAQTVSLIPFVRTLAGGRLFDHNRVRDPLAAYTLAPADNWSVPDDGTCAGAAPRAIAVATFAQGWTDSLSGALVQGGKLDLAYDVYRIPSGFGCTTDGVNAWAVTAYAELSPSGALSQQKLDGPLDAATGKYASLPLELELPAGTTSISLWFLDSSECKGDEWDSRYGVNYVYSVSP